MTGRLVVFGGPPPRKSLERLSVEATLVLTDGSPPGGYACEGLEDRVAPADLDAAVALLKKLNALRDATGTPDAARDPDHDPWWFHQQTALDEYLVPFLRYRRLLAECAASDRVVLVDCPHDLRRLLPLIPFDGHVELHDRGATRSSVARKVRRIASAGLYRIATAGALVRALVRRPDTLVYTIDAVGPDGRHPWIEGLYRTLDERGRPFLEILWSDSGARALRHARIRKRSVVFWQAVAVGVRGPVPPCGPGASGRADGASMGGTAASGSGSRSSTGDRAIEYLTDRFLHNLAARVLLPAARGSTRTVRRLEQLLRLLRPGGVYLMDDYVHAFELVVACKRRGIPTVALQHGQFSRYTAGLMGYGFHGQTDQSFDRYCVWSDFFARLLERHSQLVPPASVIVGGSPRASAVEREAGGRAATGPAPARAGSGAAVAPTILFLVEHYGDAVQRREVSAYLQAIVDAGFDVLVKPHPSGGWLPAAAPTDPHGSAPRVVSAPLDELLAARDVVIGSFSSAIFDAMLQEKPIVLFATSRYRDPHGLAAAGLAALATSPAEIVEKVAAGATLPARELERRRECVWGNGSSDAGRVAVLEMERLRRARRGSSS